MKILALDVSTKSTGWFITKRSCGIIAPDPELSFSERLVFFRREVLRLLEKYQPDVAVIEDTYLRFGNVQTLKQLARFSGVAMEVCASQGAKVDTITATQARKYCCGEHKGEFKKPQVFDYMVKSKGFDSVCERLYRSPCNFSRDNDLTDAAALAMAYKVMHRHGR
jgi:Holliday junction resolvasome RuvABC endonuclease subunit